MSEITLHFETARFAQQLFNGTEANLHAVEEKLGVRVVSRDGWIRIEGDDAKVESAREFFGVLEESLKAGARIRNRDFRQALGVLSADGSEALRKIHHYRILTSPKKSYVVPKTVGQMAYLDAIKGHDVTFGIGPAGTGKTYLAMAKAVEALKQESVSRIILTRPAVEAGEALGFLPGDLSEKIAPYLRPLYDALYDMLPFDEVQKYMEREIIEIAPLAYMRGRTLNGAFIILDEAQNTTAEQLFMFLTRLGYGSKAVITGDPTQVDLPSNKTSGLVEAERALNKVQGLALIRFGSRDVVRHPLVQRIIHAYEAYRGKK